MSTGEGSTVSRTISFVALQLTIKIRKPIKKNRVQNFPMHCNLNSTEKKTGRIVITFVKLML
jgi:hypothetical protein